MCENWASTISTIFSVKILDHVERKSIQYMQYEYVCSGKKTEGNSQISMTIYNIVLKILFSTPE